MVYQVVASCTQHDTIAISINFYL